MTNLLNPPDLAHTPVCIQNRLLYPNGAPATGERVRFVMRVYEGWLDHTMPGRVLGTSTAWTDAQGVWSALLLPYTAFAQNLQPSIYVDVYELDQHVGVARIEPAEKPGETRWLRDCLVDPPPLPTGRWQPISVMRDLHDVQYATDEHGKPLPPNEGDVLVFTEGRWRPAEPPSAATDLASLTDVDGNAVDEAADDAVLVKRGGVWTAVPLNLPALADVDKDSMKDPQRGNTLTYLGPQGWGVSKAETVWLGWRLSPVDETGRSVTLEIISAESGRGFVLWWGDEDPDNPGDGLALPADTTSVEHTYAADGEQWVYLQYADADADANPATAPVTIPLTEPVEVTNEQ